MKRNIQRLWVDFDYEKQLVLQTHTKKCLEYWGCEIRLGAYMHPKEDGWFLICVIWLVNGEDNIYEIKLNKYNQKGGIYCNGIGLEGVEWVRSYVSVSTINCSVSGP